MYNVEFVRQPNTEVVMVEVVEVMVMLEVVMVMLEVVMAEVEVEVVASGHCKFLIIM